MITQLDRKSAFVTFAVTSVVVLAAPSIAAAGGTAHDPIVIQRDSDFTSASASSGCRCVVSGAGTPARPYVVGPWSINSAAGTAVMVDGTSLTKSFVLSNLTIAGNGARTGNGVVLQNINTAGTQSITAAVTGSATSIQTTGVGITVLGSNYVTLDGGGANPAGPGIAPTGAGTINKNTDGAIDVKQSNFVTVRGWQLSANGGDQSPDWLGLNPNSWGVGGVRLLQANNSTVDHNAANNDTDISYSLFDSSNDQVTANTANYPFTTNVMVADGSTSDSVTGNELATSDFIGILIADPLPGYGVLETYGATHDISVEGNLDHSDGPIGNELKANIVPAFVGGITVLNGAYNNRITGNQVREPAIGGLVWAQAVPASTPIGVVTALPLLHCNVTLSEGGGGVSYLNGNVWSGNLTPTQDACIPPQ